jgi:RNA recognition motif-containing protein
VTKLYVGNLPFTATDETVRTLFSKHGTVEKVSLITDRDTGRPRGFGFVEMSNADASRAMQALNGADLDGRALKVNEAQDRERSGGGGGGGNRGGPRRY